MLGGRYQLEQRIGVGGMSEVWRGYDRVLARPVAVKLLTPEAAVRHLPPRHARVRYTMAPDLVASDPVASDPVAEAARAEARSAAQLIHPNVAGVFDFGRAAAGPAGRPGPYIVMELVEGATLAEHLAAGPLDWDIAVRICAEVSAGLAAAHSHGIVHRDIKPANIMLTPSGVKVLDFGIATSAGQCDQQPDGTVLGTPAYLAPERISGGPATPATDMYSVGVLLYECLTGRLPWPCDTPTRMLEAHRYGRPAPLPAIAGLAPEAADLCTDCLNEAPAERPTSHVAALVLAEAVDARVYVPPVGASAPPPPTAREHVGRHRAATEPDAWLSRPTEASRRPAPRG
nr:serine/threonine-protein kinase [Planosporangium mesophilum]